MKILQVISYGHVAGGAEKSVLFLKKNLQQRGHQVRVVTSNHAQNDPGQRFSDLEFPEIDSPGVSLFAKTLKHLWYKPAYQAIKATIAEFNPDVVHFHTMGQLSPSALFAIGKVPGVLTVHGPEEYTLGILEWGLPRHLFRDGRVSIYHLTPLGKAYHGYFRFLQRPLYVHGFQKHLKLLIAPSQYMADVLKKERYGLPIQQIYNGIELPKPKKLRNQQRLLYVGRLEHVKGVDVLLKALRIVAKQLPNTQLSIVGEGTARPELEEFVKQNSLQKQVTFHGWLKSQEVSDQYTQATAVVIPSIWPENLPTVCIEALASGRPVIGTKSGGIPELIQDGVTGRVVPKGNADALAEAIQDLLSRPGLPKMSAVCAASMQNFAITTFVQNIENVYRQVACNTEELA